MSGYGKGDCLYKWFYGPCRKQASFRTPSPSGLTGILRVDWQLSKLRRSTYEKGMWELMTMVGVN